MKFILLFLPVLFLAACSAQQQQANNEETEEEIYVFDEPAPGDEFDADVSGFEAPKIYSQYYVVQIGAFTTKDKAEEFSEYGAQKLNKQLSVSYSDQVNLFVVQIEEKFSERKEAEALRNSLWKTKDFKDAWILTVSE